MNTTTTTWISFDEGFRRGLLIEAQDVQPGDVIANLTAGRFEVAEVHFVTFPSQHVVATTTDGRQVRMPRTEIMDAVSLTEREGR
jgi:hypothetical protein